MIAGISTATAQLNDFRSRPSVPPTSDTSDDVSSELRAPGSGPDAERGRESDLRADDQVRDVSRPGELSPGDKKRVRELQLRDAEVRRHEQAHAAAGGAYAGSPRYDYERGPDGKQYATSGSVQIDVAPVQGDPEATISKMMQVKRAALAPAQPSSQDRAVAARAQAQLAQAQRERNQERALGSEAQEVTAATRGEAAYTSQNRSRGSQSSAALGVMRLLDPPLAA